VKIDLRQKPEFTFSIDWVSITMPPDDARQFASLKQWGAIVPTSTKGLNGYEKKIAHECGMLHLISTKREDMGEHFMFSGNALRWVWEKHDFSPFELLRLAVDEYKGRASRVDFAIDVKNIALVPSELYKLPKTVKGKGRKPKPHLHIEPDGSQTLYIGSRESDRTLRIYNKAAEMGLDASVLWTRIEMEFKGMNAHAIGYHAPRVSTQEFYEMCSAFIARHFDCDNDVYKQAISQKSATLDLPKPDERDTFKWLVKSVAPSIVRLMVENPSRDIWGEFCAAIEAILEKKV